MNYDNIYRGIIIQNNDPDNMGRVKVFIPHISMTLYKGWNEEVEVDKFFRNPGNNLDSALTADILKRLKEALPWTEVLQPIFGPSGSAYYHAEADFTHIDGSANPESELTDNKEIGSQTTNFHSKLESGSNNIMTPTKSSYGSVVLNDKNNSVGANSKIVNTLPDMTSPRGNQPNGFISIPDVGNHVWVVFEGGDAEMPLVVGSIISKSDHLTNSGIVDKS